MQTYMQSLKTPKAWFTANVDKILDLYGIEHQLHKEDLYFIIGTLDTAEYGLFVNHYHPDGQVHFNVFTERREGQKWGTWTTDTVTNTDGPNYAEESAPKISANKVSEYKQP
jgi:abelson tyrosine-protein kinase 1